MDILTAILSIIVFMLVLYLFSPLLFLLGKYFLRLVTLNRFPPENPDQKTMGNVAGVGLFLLIFAFIIYILLKNDIF